MDHQIKNFMYNKSPEILTPINVQDRVKAVSQRSHNLSKATTP